MIKQLWNKLNYNWYRSQYRDASNICIVTDYVAIFVIGLTAISTKLTGGIVIGSLTDTVVMVVLFSCLFVMLITITISLTLSVVDNYERKLSEGK